jgi:hypothetical protein
MGLTYRLGGDVGAEITTLATAGDVVHHSWIFSLAVTPQELAARRA